jgi:hypothetical protein
VGTVDLLTARHEKGGPDHFRVDLWNILPRPIGESDLDPMLHGLHAFQAWYGDLVEQAETRGFSPDHCLNLRGNLVGTSLRGGRLLELLSHSGSCLCFWTWKRIPGGFDVVPAYGRTPALRATRNRLKRLLNHLSWRDVDERDERTAAVRL